MGSRIQSSGMMGAWQGGRSFEGVWKGCPLNIALRNETCKDTLQCAENIFQQP